MVLRDTDISYARREVLNALTWWKDACGLASLAVLVLLQVFFSQGRVERVMTITIVCALVLRLGTFVRYIAGRYLFSALRRFVDAAANGRSPRISDAVFVHWFGYTLFHKELAIVEPNMTCGTPADIIMDMFTRAMRV